MAAARRNWALRGLTAGLAVLVALLAVDVGGAATTERIVTDRHSGLAINGFDPVAYFTDAKALLGREEFEHEHAGVVWRFRNEGNRAAFAANPEIYRPQFGGYDPVGVARGVAVPGNPQIWAFVEQRLYMFFDAAARRTFLAGPEQSIEAAEARWSEVERTLAQ